MIVFTCFCTTADEVEREKRGIITTKYPTREHSRSARPSSQSTTKLRKPNKKVYIYHFKTNYFGSCSVNVCFNFCTDPIIPANVWNHFVGTYDAHSGLAKIFVNGRLKADGVGKGLLSQDWDAHAGIGKHKDERFLQGEVDEFRIYNRVLSQGEIQNLTKACSFERGECFSSYWYLLLNRVTVVIAF